MNRLFNLVTAMPTDALESSFIHDKTRFLFGFTQFFTFVTDISKCACYKKVNNLKWYKYKLACLNVTIPLFNILRYLSIRKISTSSNDGPYFFAFRSTVTVICRRFACATAFRQRRVCRCLGSCLPLGAARDCSGSQLPFLFDNSLRELNRIYSQ